jgi:hypothetical protein
MSIDFSCTACGQQYRVKEEFAGKSTKCKKCGARIAVPQPAAEELEPLGALGSLLDEELGAVASSAFVAASAPASDFGPACGAPLPQGGRICLACGCDSVAEKARAANALSAPKAKPPPTRSFRLLRGTAVSALGAVIGAVAWAMVALLTGLELRFIACAIGAATGAGMSTAYDDHTDGMLRGIIAAGMALVGIFLGKLLIVMLLFSLLVSQLDRFDVKRQALAADMVRKSLEEQDVVMENVDNKAYQMAFDVALDSLADVDDAEIERRFNALTSQTTEEIQPLARPPDALEAQPPSEQKSATVVEAPVEEIEDEPADVSPVALFFLLMFRPLDALFVVVAIAAAYKMGSGLTTG